MKNGRWMYRFLLCVVFPLLLYAAFPADRSKEISPPKHKFVVFLSFRRDVRTIPSLFFFAAAATSRDQARKKNRTSDELRAITHSPFGMERSHTIVSSLVHSLDALDCQCQLSQTLDGTHRPYPVAPLCLFLDQALVFAFPSNLTPSERECVYYFKFSPDPGQKSVEGNLDQLVKSTLMCSTYHTEAHCYRLRSWATQISPRARASFRLDAPLSRRYYFIIRRVIRLFVLLRFFFVVVWFSYIFGCIPFLILFISSSGLSFLFLPFFFRGEKIWDRRHSRSYTRVLSRGDQHAASHRKPRGWVPS